MLRSFKIRTAAATLVVTFANMAPGMALEPPAFDILGARKFDAETAPASALAAQSMVVSPAGAFLIGRKDGPADEAPAHEVRLETLRIDRTEVTNAAFAEFLNALALEVAVDFSAGALRLRNASADVIALLAEGRSEHGRYPLIALDDAQALIGYRNGRFAPTPGFEDHPVTETTWAGARAYCRWRGARLPTEVEWEAAARGGDDRLYPWGQEAPDATRAHFGAGTGDTAPVGDRIAGASPIGALDMSGSMADWTASLKAPYPYRDDDGREDPTTSGERVTRGGDYTFDDAPETLTATHRNGFSNRPSRGHRHIGFRCAADVLES
ncbi:MAG: SUMF1/EgtB/PvdO family nonheme iron enzyme [Pseudomonadota bacterium]